MRKISEKNTISKNSKRRSLPLIMPNLESLTSTSTKRSATSIRRERESLTSKLVTMLMMEKMMTKKKRTMDLVKVPILARKIKFWLRTMMMMMKLMKVILMMRSMMKTLIWMIFLIMMLMYENICFVILI